VQARETDAIVFKCRAPAPATERLAGAIAVVTRSQALPATDMTINLSLDGAELYAYLFLREPAEVAPAPLAAALARAAGVPAVEAVRLARLQEIRGASYGEAAVFHYVVETDVVPESERDLNDWYNVEHLPGLAAVPGTIRAQRFLNLDGAPRYHSCYELVTQETLGSPPWLAVRHTAWSDRVRPSFRNTKRTMFRRVAGRPL
jgi:hypothetical protein